MVLLRQTSLIPTRPPSGTGGCAPRPPCLAADGLPERFSPLDSPLDLTETEQFHEGHICHPPRTGSQADILWAGHLPRRSFGMNVIWIVADTFRQDHLGAYGKAEISTPSLDALAAKSMRFERHYAAGFPTMPTRADHATGRWTMSFMGWEPIPDEATTLAEMLAMTGRAHGGHGGHALLPARRHELRQGLPDLLHVHGPGRAPSPA